MRTIRSAGAQVRQAEDQLSLCEVLDRVLNKGAVIHGDITISVAGIDLLYVGLRLIVSSIEAARRAGARLPESSGCRGDPMWSPRSAD